MSDKNFSQPVRTELDGDVVVKIADKDTSSQHLAVNPDGSINIADNGGSITVDATDLDIRDLTFADDAVDVSGSTVELGATTLAALESVTVQNGAGGAAVNIQDGGNSITVDATDLDIRDLVAASDSVSAHLKDEAGNAFSSANPLPVEFFETASELFDQDESIDLAEEGTLTHDYTTTGDFKLFTAYSSASGKIRADLFIETAAASNTFVKVGTKFNSVSYPNVEWKFAKGINVANGAKVRVVSTNLDKDEQNVYSTIVGTNV
jgi:hypothetical protein